MDVRVLPRADMVLSKKKVIDLILDGNYVYKDRGKLLSCRSPLQIFVREPNCPGFETSVKRDFTTNEYLAEPFDFLWPTLFLCVQNFTFFFMVETAQKVVVTAQRGLSNCAAAHARSLEGTLLVSLTKFLTLCIFLLPYDLVGPKIIEMAVQKK